MSFILDALKKSESERQRTNTPGIADVPVGVSRPGSPRWLWPLSGLLAVNLVVLLVVLLRPEPAAPSRTAPPAAAPPVQATETRAVAPQAAMPAREEPAAVATIDAAPDRPQADAPPAPGRATSPAPAAPRQAPSKTETLLTFNDVRASGNVGLADMHIDIHVYSEKPSDRFVFINMNQYRENATLAEGPLLREITAEGVILEYAGTTFLLPRE
jgi:general secretion pathway protein B